MKFSIKGVAPVWCLSFAFLETFSSSKPLLSIPFPTGGRGWGSLERQEEGAAAGAQDGRFAYLRSSESGRRKFAYVNTDLHSPSQEDRPTVTETLTK